MSNCSDYLENKIIDIILRNTAWTPPATVYVTLHNADPGETSTWGSSEGAWGGGTPYARQAVTFAAPSGGITTNGNTITFPAVTGAQFIATHATIADNATAGAGNKLFVGALTSSKTLDIGDVPSFPIGSISITIQ
jgi:hypothetical protein